jgi:hypothetical protein
MDYLALLTMDLVQPPSNRFGFPERGLSSHGWVVRGTTDPDLVLGQVEHELSA